MFLQTELCFDGALAEKCEIRVPSRHIGVTRCQKWIKFLMRAKREQDRSAFELWWPCYLPITVWRTNWKVITTRQIEQVLCGCIISDECCWNRTVLHDESHCRILTIPCSGMSWVFFVEWRRNVTTKRMDPREHQTWTRVGSCNLLLPR